MNNLHRDLTDPEVARFKKWAADNFAPGRYINATWNPVVVDEWNRLQAEYEESWNRVKDENVPEAIDWINSYRQNIVIVIHAGMVALAYLIYNEEDYAQRDRDFVWPNIKIVDLDLLDLGEEEEFKEQLRKIEAMAQAGQVGEWYIEDITGDLL